MKENEKRQEAGEHRMPDWKDGRAHALSEDGPLELPRLGTVPAGG